MALGALTWSWTSQPATTINHGFGWDGQHYAAIHSYFSSGVYRPIAPAFPYLQRVGLPFLAAHISLPPRESFFLLHAIFWCSTMVLFAICCRVYVGLTATSIYFGVLWLQILWASIPRSAASYSFTVDSAALFFMQTWILLLMSQRWYWFLPVCAFVGVLFKETVLLLVLLSFVVLLGMFAISRFKRAIPTGFPNFRTPLLPAVTLAVVAASIGKRLASHVLPGNLIRGSELMTMLGWLDFRIIQDPFQILRYLAAAFSAYGGFALLRVATLGKPRIHEHSWRLTFATALCPLYFAICFVAGSDLTKFALMAFPFALPILLAELEEVSAEFALLALLLGLPAAHALTPIPSAIHDLPSVNLQDLQGLYSWMMEYAHRAVVGSWLAWWLGCILLLRSVGFARTWRAEFQPAGHAPLTADTQLHESPDPAVADSRLRPEDNVRPVHERFA